MIFMNRLHNFPTTLPASIRETISHHAPTQNSITDYCSDWYTEFNCKPYNTSMFFKGPLLYTDIMTNNTHLQNISVDSYKKRIKIYLLDIQSSGSCQEWQFENFKLTNIPGLRRSNRLIPQDN